MSQILLPAAKSQRSTCGFSSTALALSPSNSALRDLLKELRDRNELSQLPGRWHEAA